MQKQGRTALGIELLREAILQNGSIFLYHRNLCEMLRLEHRLDEAAEAGRRAIALRPDDALAHHFLGVIHSERGDLDESIRCSRRSLELDPGHAGTHFELAEALLLRGDLVEGFAEYEWRHQMKSVPPLLSPRPLQPLWEGQQVAPGGLLLVADQGFGDVIQFCRYLPMVAERSPGFVVACNPEVVPILRQQAGVGRSSRAAGPAGFLQLVAAVDIAAHLRDHARHHPDADSLYPGRAGTDSALGRADAGAVPAGYLRVGIVWAGRPTHGNDRNRSTTLKAFAPIAALDRVVLVSLQMGAPQTQLDGYAGRAPLVDLGREIVDFGDSAAILENLDLVIAVDTSIVHLAGAMGRPVWALLASAPDWRWMLNREDSPWYPSVVLLRQPAPGRWDPLLESAAKRLQAMTPGA